MSLLSLQEQEGRGDAHTASSSRHGGDSLKSTQLRRIPTASRTPLIRRGPWPRRFAYYPAIAELTLRSGSATVRPMLTIRLQRRGRKNDPSFRVLVLDSKQGPKTGKYLEMVGSYDARSNRVELQGERIKHWMSQGAQVSDTVHNLLISNGIVEGKKRNVLPKKTVAKVDTPAQAAEAAPVVSEDAPAAAEAAPAEEPASAPAPESSTEEKTA